MLQRPVRSERYPWYDSVWLAKHARARAILREVRPDLLPGFIDAFRALGTRPGFEALHFERLLDAATMAEVRRVVASLHPSDLELHEAGDFGRFVVHDHPYFTALQQRIVPLVSEAVGEAVEPAYNFLSLYGHRGVCPPHLDSPEAKWTVDLCLAQDRPWPLFVSQVCPWPEGDPVDDGRDDDDWQRAIKQSPALRFTGYPLEPGQALVFSGSSQWHYRDPIEHADHRTYCQLLFLHFIPAGTAHLLRPGNWARVFGVPELADVA